MALDPARCVLSLCLEIPRFVLEPFSEAVPTRRHKRRRASSAAIAIVLIVVGLVERYKVAVVDPLSVLLETNVLVAVGIDDA